MEESDRQAQEHPMTREVKSKKTNSFIMDPCKRRRFDINKVKQMKSKIEKWYSRTKASVASFSFIEGKIFFSASPDLRTLCEDPLVMGKIVNLIEKGVNAEDEGIQCPELTVPFNWKSKNVVFKRTLVKDLVTSKGSKAPHWGKEEHKPFWWPGDVPFVSPNDNRVHCRHRVQSLDKIIDAFLTSRPAGTTTNNTNPANIQEADNHTDDNEREFDDDDDNCDDDVVDNIADADNFISSVDKKVVGTLLSETTNTSDNAEKVLQHMTRMSWSHLKLFCTEFSPSFREMFDACSVVEKSITPSDVAIWERCNVKVKGEPIKTVGDGNCLYRALSQLSKNCDQFWAIMKLAIHAQAVIDEGVIIEKLKTGLHGLFPFDVMEHIIRTSDIIDYVSEGADHVQDVFRKEIVNGLSKSQLGGILQIYLSARFLKQCIGLTCNFEGYSFGEKVYPCDTDTDKAPLQLILVSSHPNAKSPDHFLPIVELDLPVRQDRCDAGKYCMLGNRDFPVFCCKFCLLTYHVVCINLGCSTGTPDDCGCIDIVEGKERLISFSDGRAFDVLLSSHSEDVMRFVHGLYFGDIPSCRNTRNQRLQYELNRLWGKLPSTVQDTAAS